MSPDDMLDDSALDRRNLLKLLGAGTAATIAGCGGDSEGSNTPDDGTQTQTPDDGGQTQQGGSGEQGSGFQNEIDNINFEENWQQRRLTTLDEWPVEKRNQIPSGDALYSIDGWLDSEAVKSAPWEPPAGWEETAASEVDTLQILNYGNLDFDPATVATYALFEEKTGIEIEPVEVNTTQAIPRAAAYLSSEQQQPHLQCAATWNAFAQYAGEGHLEPVEFLMPNDEMWEEYLPVSQNLMTFNGTQYGAPNIIEGKAVHVRPDLLEEQGVDSQTQDKILEGDWNWSDLETVMQAFEGTDMYAWGYRGGSANLAEVDWREMFYQAGGQYYEDGEVIVNNEPGLTALQKMVEWRDNDWVPQAVNSFVQGDLADGFLSGDFAMVPVATDLVSDSLDQFEKGSQYTITLPMEAGSAAPSSRKATTTLATAITINKYADTAHKVAAALYQDCRFSLASGWWEYTHEGNMTYVEDALSQAAEVDATVFADTKDEIMQVAMAEVFPQQQVIVSKVSEEVRLAIAGDKTPQTALDDAQSYIDTVLSQ